MGLIYTVEAKFSLFLEYYLISYALISQRNICFCQESKQKDKNEETLYHRWLIRRDYLHNTGVTELRDWNCQPLITRRTFSRKTTDHHASQVSYIALCMDTMYANWEGLNVGPKLKVIK